VSSMPRLPGRGSSPRVSHTLAEAPAHYAAASSLNVLHPGAYERRPLRIVLQSHYMAAEKPLRTPYHELRTS